MDRLNIPAELLACTRIRQKETRSTLAVASAKSQMSCRVSSRLAPHSSLQEEAEDLPED